MIPNLSRRIFGEGAASSSVIPIYSEELKKNKTGSVDLARTVVTVITTVLIAIVIVGEIGIWWFCKYNIQLEETRRMMTLVAIMLPYMCLICVVAILAGLLNSHRHFAMPAVAPIVLNLFIITGLCISGWGFNLIPEKQVFVLAFVVIAAGIAQLLIQLIPLSKYGVTLKPAWKVNSEPFKRIIFLMGPMILGLTVTQLNTLADGVIAKCLSSGPEKGEFFMWFGSQIQYPVREGAVGSLYLSQRLYQFPLGVLGISLATAIFPILSAAAADNDQSLLTQTIRRGIQSAFFVAMPATVGLILVARPLTALIYQSGEFSADDTRRVQTVLIFYSVGLCGYFLQQLVTRSFYSIKDSKWPARTALIAVMVNVILNLTLIWILGVAGLALATATCSYLQVIILLAILNRKFKLSLRNHLWSTLAKTIIGSLVMAICGIICHYAMRPLPHRWILDFIRVALMVTVCTSVYIVAARLLGNEMLDLLVRRCK